MRKFNFLIATCSALLLAGPLSATQTGKEFQQKSVDLAANAKGLLSAGKTSDAQFTFERALLADPSNVQALIGLGESHEAQDRVGKGLKYYRQALEIEPNNRRALLLQGLAFLKRDIVKRSEENLDRLKMVCGGTDCGAFSDLEKAVAAFHAKSQMANADNAAVTDEGDKPDSE